MNGHNKTRYSFGRGLCVATALVAAMCFGGTAAAEPVATPDRDPFYAAPADLGSYADGAILNSRPSAFYGLPLPVNAWQVKYKSTDADGRPTTGVATVLVPPTPWLGPGPRPVVSYQMAEDGLGIQCASSYVLRAGAAAGLQNGQDAEAPVAALLLSRNWAVVIADYEGPQERFLDRRQTAHSALDGVRAALAFPPAGLSSVSPVVGFGYSGGAFATVSMMEIQPQYAPELNVTGFAAGGIPADIFAAIVFNNGTKGAGMSVLATAALNRLSPGADILGQFDDPSRAAIEAAGSQCVQQAVNGNNFRRLTGVEAGSDLARISGMAAAAAQQDPGQAVPTAPMYAWHSTLDDALPVASTDQLVAGYCAAGATVTYHRTNVPEHAPAAVAELPAAIAYLGDRLGGVPVPPGCRTV